MCVETERNVVARIGNSLMILCGPLSGQKIPIRKLIIGRENDCHFQAISGFISRHQCVLLRDAGFSFVCAVPATYAWQRFGSQTGTWSTSRCSRDALRQAAAQERAGDAGPRTRRHRPAAVHRSRLAAA